MMKKEATQEVQSAIRFSNFNIIVLNKRGCTFTLFAVNNAI